MKFERAPSNPNATSVCIGPLHIVAHKSGEWTVFSAGRAWDSAHDTGKELNWGAAERAAVAKAREIVDGWARELETLAEDLRK